MADIHLQVKSNNINANQWYAYSKHPNSRKKKWQQWENNRKAFDHNDVDMFGQVMHPVVTFIFMPLSTDCFKASFIVLNKKHVSVTFNYNCNFSLRDVWQCPTKQKDWSLFWEVGFGKLVLTQETNFVMAWFCSKWCHTNSLFDCAWTSPITSNRTAKIMTISKIGPTSS